MTTDPASLTARLRSSRVRRRDVLIGGAVGAAIVLAPPIRARATMPAGLGRAIRELMAAGRLPGLSAAVVRGGEVVWSHAWGMANIEAGRRATPDTLFMLASVSKTVVATAVLQAIEDDLFGLDTHVNDVLPFPVRNRVHPDEPITVRQLLTHTSSIRDNWTLLTASYVDGDAEMELRTFLRRYLAPGGADLAPNNYYSFGPGRSYRYANVGVSLAAFLVEAAAGIGFDTWCERRIFAPLGMDRAGWHLAGLPRREIAMPYTWSGNKNAYVPTGQYGYPDYPDGAAQDDGPAARPAPGDGDGRRLVAWPPSPVGGHGPGAAAGPGAGPRAGPGTDLVRAAAGGAGRSSVTTAETPASPPSASSIPKTTWASSRSRTEAGARPAAITRCTRSWTGSSRRAPRLG